MADTGRDLFGGHAQHIHGLADDDTVGLMHIPAGDLANVEVCPGDRLDAGGQSSRSMSKLRVISGAKTSATLTASIKKT